MLTFNPQNRLSLSEVIVFFFLYGKHCQLNNLFFVSFHQIAMHPWVTGVVNPIPTDTATTMRDLLIKKESEENSMPLKSDNVGGKHLYSLVFSTLRP
jgi:hypothetical protein